MATAVVRVIVDAEGELSSADFHAGVQSLRDSGWMVLAASGRLADRRREVELVVEGASRVTADEYLPLCSEAFGLPAQPGVVTYVSRGTDDDAVGVLTRFGTVGEVERTLEGSDEIVHVRIPRTEQRRVPESRLLTAMEAALNCEVRLEFV